MDVGAWLKRYGLEEYAEAFAENGVDALCATIVGNQGELLGNPGLRGCA